MKTFKKIILDALINGNSDDGTSKTGFHAGEIMFFQTCNFRDDISPILIGLPALEVDELHRELTKIIKWLENGPTGVFVEAPEELREMIIKCTDKEGDKNEKM